jgi:ABC-type glycerol-3-phosphate transport system substrate-binding protein
MQERVQQRGVTRRRVMRRGAAAGGSALGAMAVVACASGGQASADALGVKRLKPGSSITWRTYVANPPMPDEINKLWTAKHPDIKISVESITGVSAGASISPDSSSPSSS